MIEEHWRPTGSAEYCIASPARFDDAAGANGHGFLISFAGIQPIQKRRTFATFAKALPLEKILIETGRSVTSRRNRIAASATSPLTWGGSGAHACDCERLDSEEIAAAHDGEFRRFFGLARPASLTRSGFKAMNNLGDYAIALLTVKRDFDLGPRRSSQLSRKNSRDKPKLLLPPVSEITAYLLGGGEAVAPCAPALSCAPRRPHRSERHPSGCRELPDGQGQKAPKISTSWAGGDFF